MIDKRITFLKEHCEFNKPSDCYVLLAVSRKKDTKELTNSKEIVFREVLRRQNDIERKLRRLTLCCKSYRDKNGKKYPFYIYITCNARNGKIASKIILDKIVNCFYDEAFGHDRSRIFNRIDRLFISALMKPQSRGSTRYFSIDVDTKNTDFIAKIQEALGFEIIKTYKMIDTRNGIHIKTQPFNVKEFNDQFSPEELNKLVSVNRDRLLFVDYIKR